MEAAAPPSIQHQPSSAQHQLMSFGEKSDYLGKNVTFWADEEICGRRSLSVENSNM